MSHGNIPFGQTHGIQIRPGDVSVIKMLEMLKPHDHLCLIYESKEEWRAMVVPFISIGLRQGEKCIYVVDTSTAEEIRNYLLEEGVDVDSAEKSGQLSILDETEAYTREGSFDPDKMIDLLISETGRAVSEGYPALRVTGEMTWVLRGHPGSEKLLEYEAKLNRDLFPQHPCLAICQYDRWRFAPEIIKGVVMTHPLLVRSNRVYRNFYYIPPEEFLGQKRAEIEVQHWLNNLEREQKMWEDLREDEEKFRAVVENSNDGIIITASNGSHLYANQRASEITGYSNEELLKVGMKGLVHSDEIPKLSERLKKRLSGEEVPGQYETRIVHKSGKTVPIEISASKTIWHGQVADMVILRDITERKNIEEQLKDSEKKYRDLFENAIDGIVIADIETGIILDCNKAIESLVEKTRAELIGQSQKMLHPPEDEADGFSKTFIEHRNKREGQILETQVITSSGERKYVDIKANILELKDRKVLQGIFRNVTERKRIEKEKTILEEQFRQAQKMEAIGRLAGGIAHDFNNLLTLINGNCQLSLLELREGDSLRGNIEEIKAASDRAAELTKQLLAFSRKQILEPQVIDLNQVLQGLDKMIRRIIGEDVELEVIPVEPIGRVKADPGQIEQVIMNLAVNARDAMPIGGKLTIETANVELDDAYANNHIAVKPGRYVMLSISDTGVGMTPEVKERVFEPFFTTKERGKGTGLGLSTVYGIVKQSGGNIWVYSEPSKGTTFKIYLPQVEEPLEELKEKVVGEELPRGSETILLVEDEEVVRKLAARILRRQGYTVLEALGAEDALRTCEERKEPLHLILTDVVMPVMSGRQLVDACWQVRQDFKVLYMSGYTDNAIVHHGVLREGIDYIQKPFTVDGLARKVRGVLDK